MIGAFTYKGISSYTYNLICKSVNRPLLPALRSNTTTFSTVSGVYDSGNVEYDLRNVTMKIQYLGTSFQELRSRARQIAAWLGGGEWGQLIIEGEDDKYYWAKIEGDIELDTVFEYGEADIQFVCQPFAYALNEITQSINNGTHVINNPGTRHIDNRSPVSSLFKIVATGGSGTISFNMNGRSLTFNSVTGGVTFPVTIDNVQMAVTNVSFHALQGSVDKFLRLNPGNNTMYVSGVSSGYVTFRPMYY